MDFELLRLHHQDSVIVRSILQAVVDRVIGLEVDRSSRTIRSARAWIYCNVLVVVSLYCPLLKPTLRELETKVV